MLIARLLTLLALFALASCEHIQPRPTGQVVEVRRGALVLRGIVWKPSGRGPFPAVFFNHGRPDTPDQHIQQRYPEKLGPIFARHGYVFLYLFRHGEGLSAEQGRFIGAELAEAERAGGAEARRQAQLKLLSGSHLVDGMAGIAYLRSRGDVDPGRLAVVGHSFGAQLALLEAERDPSLRGVVAFAPAAGSWNGSPELRQRLIQAVRTIRVPVLIIHAANDYSTQPGRDLAIELSRLSKPNVLRIYPPYGSTPDQGHSFLFYDTRWEADVFELLDAVTCIKRGACGSRVNRITSPPRSMLRPATV